MARKAPSPRALAGPATAGRQGQQTRCDSGADGHSPDKERTGLPAWAYPVRPQDPLRSKKPCFSRNRSSSYVFILEYPRYGTQAARRRAGHAVRLCGGKTGGRMFTGIIESIGSVRAMTPKGGDLRVYIATGKLDLGDVKLGDSIAVNGVCLTAVELPGDGFWADVSRESLARTAFQHLKVGSRVNLEKALTPTTRLGGHLVSGHVDGVGEVLKREENARAIQFTVRAPRELARYIAHKGSITVDGTSLTVNAVNGAEFELTIVPHTLSETIMAEYQPGRRVNLEVDLLARYLERLLLGDKAAEPSASGISEAFLAENGFLK
ncbi:riboflavin synthase subunit alpha [Pseudomonas aeruginosa MH38]|nr:riboflavin synthase subunit alpha [Pseudomonas aeruginosa MH38]